MNTLTPELRHPELSRPAGEFAASPESQVFDAAEQEVLNKSGIDQADLVELRTEIASFSELDQTDRLAAMEQRLAAIAPTLVTEAPKQIWTEQALSEYLAAKLTEQAETFVAAEPTSTNRFQRTLKWTFGDEELSFLKRVPIIMNWNWIKNGRKGDLKIPRIIKGGKGWFATSFANEGDTWGIATLNTAIGVAERFVNSLKTKAGARRAVGYVLVAGATVSAMTGNLPLSGVLLGARASLAAAGAYVASEAAMTKKDIQAHTKTEWKLGWKDRVLGFFDPKHTEKSAEEVQELTETREGWAGYALGETIQTVAAAGAKLDESLANRDAVTELIQAEAKRRASELTELLVTKADRSRIASLSVEQLVEAHVISITTAFAERLAAGRIEATRKQRDRHIMAGLIGIISGFVNANLSLNRESHLITDALAPIRRAEEWVAAGMPKDAELVLSHGADAAANHAGTTSEVFGAGGEGLLRSEGGVLVGKEDLIAVGTPTDPLSESGMFYPVNAPHEHLVGDPHLQVAELPGRELDANSGKVDIDALIKEAHFATGPHGIQAHNFRTFVEQNAPTIRGHLSKIQAINDHTPSGAAERQRLLDELERELQTLTVSGKLAKHAFHHFSPELRYYILTHSRQLNEHPDQLYKALSLSSFKKAPLTNDHPYERDIEYAYRAHESDLVAAIHQTVMHSSRSGVTVVDPGSLPVGDPSWQPEPPASPVSEVASSSSVHSSQFTVHSPSGNSVHVGQATITQPAPAEVAAPATAPTVAAEHGSGTAGNTSELNTSGVLRSDSPEVNVGDAGFQNVTNAADMSHDLRRKLTELLAGSTQARLKLGDATLRSLRDLNRARQALEVIHLEQGSEYTTVTTELNGQHVEVQVNNHTGHVTNVEAEPQHPAVEPAPQPVAPLAHPAPPAPAQEPQPVPSTIPEAPAQPEPEPAMFPEGSTPVTNGAEPSAVPLSFPATR